MKDNDDKINVDGSNNVTNTGNNNHFGDKNLSFYAYIQHTTFNYFHKKKEDLKECFHILVPRTPALNWFFSYIGVLMLPALLMYLGFAGSKLIGLWLFGTFGLYMLYSWIRYRFYFLIYVMEDRYSISKVGEVEQKYSYKKIVDKYTDITNNGIKIFFDDGIGTISYNLKRDDAVLFKHKISEYTRIIGERL